MKKMLSLLLALALVFSLAACGSTGETAPAEPTAAPAEEEAAPVESLLGTQPGDHHVLALRLGRGRRADGQVH